jgi:hypothetical protein
MIYFYQLFHYKIMTKADDIYNEIIKEYSKDPFYYSGEYLCIRDDRVASVVCFRLYIENDKLKVNFRENKRIRNQIIYSYNDFKEKWSLFYSDLS